MPYKDVRISKQGWLTRGNHFHGFFYVNFAGANFMNSKLIGGGECSVRKEEH